VPERRYEVSSTEMMPRY